MIRIVCVLFPILLAVISSCSNESTSSKFNYAKADQYAQSLLDTSFMKVDYLPSQGKEVYYVKEFSGNELINVRAYCRKERYKISRNGSYQNNLLWIFEYANEDAANLAINAFIEEMELGNHEGFSNAKSGNYIVQHGPAIYSLVETCSGGNYTIREQDFLTAIGITKDESVVLKATCGGLNYEIESR
ncbi:MAG: hypothetical protein ACI837_003031 [Crocinitomicaceae bacterium]|jgi:hypothetical protein